MNSITHFQFNCQEVRFVDGKPVAIDVARVLGYASPKDAIRDLINKKYLTSVKLPAIRYGENKPRMQDVFIISKEAGIYQLIFSSKLPIAEKFQEWVFEEVLPSIRKTGSYSIEPVIPQTYIEALKALVASEEAKELLKAENKLLEQENHTLAEAVDELFDYSSIIRIAKFNKMSEKNFSWYTLKVASIKLGKEIKQVPCPRFVTKNLYSHDAWRLAYPNVPLPETTTLVIRQ